MDVDSNYSTDVTIRESDDYVRTLTTQTTKRKGRGFRDTQTRHEIDYKSIESPSTETGPAKSVQGWILIVTNVHPEASEEDITNIFGEYGPLTSLDLNIDKRTGYMKVYII
uniref:RNA-binding protein 8A (Trinotate prediction) n=1 Tax=Henneguya salminicola TaxID=69463 RepID=A0A6G3MKF6_HENSL